MRAKRLYLPVSACRQRAPVEPAAGCEPDRVPVAGVPAGPGRPTGRQSEHLF